MPDGSVSFFNLFNFFIEYMPNTPLRSSDSHSSLGSFSHSSLGSFSHSSLGSSSDNHENLFDSGRFPSSASFDALVTQALSGEPLLELTPAQFGDQLNEWVNQAAPGEDRATAQQLLVECYTAQQAAPNSLAATKLDLSNLGLKQLPDCFAHLTNLQILELFSNKLSKLPPSIGAISGLKRLNVSYNALEAVPREIAHLKELQNLELEGNRLTGLPVEITQLTKLKTLELQENDIRVLPDNIGVLSVLQYLNLRDNNRLGGVPPDIVNVGIGGGGAVLFTCPFAQCCPKIKSLYNSYL